LKKRSVAINFSEDYYAILGIDRNEILSGKDLKSRQHNADLVHRAYVNQARVWHPDLKWAGEEPEPTKEEKENRFRKIVEAHTILGNTLYREIYYRGTEEEDEEERNLIYETICNHVGVFKKDSLESGIGTTLIRRINSILCMIDNMYELEIISPDEENFHNYVWEIFIPKIKMPLTLSIVHDSDEVMRLTNSENIEESLPFKIHLFFPSTKTELVYIENVEPGSQTISGIRYIDDVLFESSNYNDTAKFINENLSDEIKNRIEE